MGEVISFKDISNWAEIFDMVFELLTFLRHAEDITPDLVIKTTFDIVQNAGYNYTFDSIEEEYYKCI